MGFRTKDINGKSKPDRRRIAKYWNVKSDTCMACGAVAHQIDRAHIFPLRIDCKKGTNAESNIHLLCTVCHGESENLRDKSYEQWFELKNICYKDGKIDPVPALTWQLSYGLQFNMAEPPCSLKMLDTIIHSGKTKDLVFYV